MNKNKIFSGSVISTKMNKTIVVLVETHRKHKKYKKRIKYRKKYYVHDENNSANVGDIVNIILVRPISKTKRFKLISIIKKNNFNNKIEDNFKDENEILEIKKKKNIINKNENDKINITNNNEKEIIESKEDKGINEKI